MKEFILFTYFFSLAMTTYAQTTSSANVPGKLDSANQNNIPEAAIRTIVALFSRQKSPKKDSVSGMCTYNSGPCNGAEVALYMKGQRIFVTTLTSMGTFQIPNLKAHENYELVLAWASKNLSKKKSVAAGEYVEIKLSND